MSQAGKYADGTIPGEFVRTLSDDVNTKVFPDGDGNIQLEGQNGITVISDPSNNKIFISGTGAAGSEIKVTKFTNDGDFEKDPRSLWIEIFLWNGGSGGGSGRQGASGLSSGGGGGAGGGFLHLSFPSIQFSTSEPVVIGQGGMGGAPQTNPDTNGNDGQPGTPSSIGNISLVPKIENTLTPGGQGGGTGFGNPGANQLIAAELSYRVASLNNYGGMGSITNGADAPPMGIQNLDGSYSNDLQYPSSGGGAGAGADSGSATTGGNGGDIILFGSEQGDTFIVLQDGGIGGNENLNIDGTDGNPFITTTMGRVIGGTGGGGGGGQSAGLVSGNGGHGGTPSGAGGGGGGSLNGTPSGAGGNGARGEIWVIETLGTLTQV